MSQADIILKLRNEAIDLSESRVFLQDDCLVWLALRLGVRRSLSWLLDRWAADELDQIRTHIHDVAILCLCAAQVRQPQIGILGYALKSRVGDLYKLLRHFLILLDDWVVRQADLDGLE